jgi:Tol biopolymer transport system component
MVVKTRGNETPVELRNDVRADDRLGMPDWSPAGDWITYRNQEGWNLISPDGKTTKRLGNLETNSLVFSKDGKQLYGILTRGTLADPDRATLFSLDPETLKQRVIKELGTDLSPTYSGNRFSLAPDGKSIAYSIVKDRRDLWMLQGYRQQGWWGRLSGIFK